jgi:metallo-beta-lactamase class B
MRPPRPHHAARLARPLLAAAVPAALAGQAAPAAPRDTAPAAAPAPACAGPATWNAPQRPFRVHGGTYYVGTRCLSAVLVTSPAGHVLIDAGLPTSAAVVRANIEALGFRVRDVRVVLNSHAHYDHAGGIAELQRASGARVLATAPSARVLAAGRSGPDDPQFGALPSFAPVAGVRPVADGDTVRVGPLALVAHATPGHTPGGTTWAWRSCAGAECVELVYADSQTPVSAPGFAFTRSRTYPAALRDFARGHATLERLRCDILITPHPEAAGLWDRLARGPAGGRPALVDPEGCRRYAAAARAQLARRVADERAREGAGAADTAALRRSLDSLARAADGRLGVTVRLLETGEWVARDAAGRYPMQSVYKLPIAMAALAAVDRGALRLDQPVTITPRDYVGAAQRSPVRDRWPAGTALPLREVLRYNTAESDGSACDVLLRLLGGPARVRAWLAGVGVTEVHVASTEREIGADPAVQYRNWATPRGVDRLLRAVHERRGLSDSAAALLRRDLVETPTGPGRLRAGVPAGTTVAHKTGSSGARRGVAAATNDVGVVTLPDGRHLAVGVLLADARGSDAARDAVIARVAALAWRHWAPR